ncbi:sialomucin core protein 24-like [Battus philenor]|uniref:sialomucin core protein 24-like n=1 Tax=Battus philenor TaxID=42288 RepID=UPI0035CED934
MKKVIFICLLSLSFCLCKPADDQVTGKLAQQNEHLTAEDPKNQVSTEKAQSVPSTTISEQKPAPLPTTIKNDASTEKSAATPDNKTNTPLPNTNENKTKKDAEPQKETEKKVEPAKQTETTTEAKPANTTDKDKSTTTTKPEEKTEKSTVTTTEKSATTIKPTEAPKKDEDKPTLQARGFDGPSFIGGIILTLGLLAIGFMGFKYYKNQTERNYHTL